MTSHRVAVFSAIVSLVSTWAYNPPRARPGKVSAAIAHSDSIIERVIRERVDLGLNAGLVVGLIDSTGRQHVYAVGVVRGPGSPRVDVNTVFEIGSITKTFTASLLADMVQRGEVALDDPVTNYLPSDARFKANGRAITLVDLATQTSGLPRLPSNMAPKDTQNPYADYSVQQMYDFLSHYELPRDIGEKYEYSNFGVGLLGHALARKSGMSYEELLKKRILEPLGMKDTAITLSPAMRAHLAPGHDAAGAAAANWDLPALAGAGALRSTANDMLKFLAANLGKADGPLGPALQETHRIRHAADNPDTDVGLAWQVLHNFGTDLTWHNGGTGGYHSWIGFVKTRGIGAVLLSNSAASIDDIGFHLLQRRFPLAQPPKQRREVTLDSKLLDTYVGEYRLSPEFSIKVTRKGNALFIEATGQSPLPIFAESENEFFVKAVDAQITFVKEKNRVTKLILHQYGRDLPGPKIK
jgi:D-alanyl-D-alanine-carboxypeptidase/D-alanyl-D-alanine-endopeptidase